ncbi:neurogenic protein mastermind isoform X2 [Sabethes cyaneus]|uniref:neurogenic protein mastermind isoform X2 n=1 Tax=Sabethes cyaneus TaxID=53552 RepID=UPI00237EC9C4|nr:neurogenic protein mastermind isoform X2 [Sabethes cyaneus]
MNVMNNSSGDEEQVECPLCMEPLEVDDLHFYPCTCGYQICRFCWHRIRTDENELCPACRKAYPENPADFTPLSQEQIAAFKAEKRQRDQQRKAKISENRKHLANVRVVQKNLVFVVGLPPRLADPEILKKHEYFGKYGKIHKVVINPSSTYAGVPSASAYVTYINNNDALKAIHSVNNINMDGRLIKTSLGTTKYCSHFMKNQTCPKPDCMYLHELGDQEASFTKEEMHQGKHQEYEKRLHDTMQAQLGLTIVNGVSSGGAVMNGSSVGGNNSTGGGVGNGNGNGGNGTGTGTTTNGILANGTNGSGKTGDSKHISDITNGPIQCKEAWPSLSTTPIDGSTHGNGGGGSNKENKINGKTVGSNKENGSRKHEKSRTKGGRKHRGTRDSDRNRERDRDLHNKENGGKDSHSKRNSSSSSSSNNRCSSSSNHVKDSTISSGANSVTNGGMGSNRKNVNGTAVSSVFGATNTVNTTVISNGNGKPVDTGVNGHVIADDSNGKEVEDSGKSLKQITISCGNGSSITASHLDDLDDDDDELDFEDLDNDALSSDNDGKTDTPSLSSSGSSHAGGDSGSTLSETPSGKSSPTAFPDPLSVINNVISTGNTTTAVVAVQDEPVPSSGAIMSTATTAITNGINSSSSSSISSSNFSSSSSTALASDDKSAGDNTELVIEPSSPVSLFSSNGNDDIGLETSLPATTSTASKQQLQQQQQQSQPQNGMNKINSLIESSTSRFAKLGIFDDNSSFFSHSTFDPYSNYNKLEGGHLDGIQSSGLTSSQLPDLLSGTNDSNEQHTKEILKNLSSIQQQQQQHHLLNNVHLQQLNGLGLGNGGIESGTTEDWEAAFSKYVMRSKLDVEHHEELLRLQEIQKRNILNSGLNGTSQLNGYNGDYADYFHNTNELNSRLLSQQQQHAHQRLQQQQQQSQHTDMTHIYANNMSKFFDFHKLQQQQQAAQHQQQQNQPFLLNGHPTDPMNIAGLLENSRLSSHFLEQHSNGLLGSQHVQKQRMLNGQLNAHSILLNGANPQQQQQQQQQSQSPQQQPNNRLHNPQQQPFSQQQNPVADDDLGFDPFIETQKALAELINDEISQQQMPPSAATTAPNHSKLLENVQRTRMPPPGFNHMNAFGFGVPRPHVSSSKILPFMNLANNSQQQQQQPQQPSWGQQLQQQQQQFMGFQQNDQNHLAQSQPPSGNNKAGYGNNFPDWTSFDPAIVSFRQFSFMNGPNQSGDMFLSAQQGPNQLNQQGMQQPGQAFGHHGINLQTNLISQQQQQSNNPQAQVNFPSHVPGSWLSSEQNAYMNSLPPSNGAAFGPTGFDKYSIPMPPGFQAAAAAAAVAAAVANKQKAECIN